MMYTCTVPSDKGCNREDKDQNTEENNDLSIILIIDGNSEHVGHA